MKHLSVRSLIVAAIGSFLVSMSSIYVALRMGALPWPTVFAAIFSMFILRFFKADIHEINVAHTGISAGGLVAGGLAFTVPAAWVVGLSPKLVFILGAASVGAVFGVGMTLSTRKKYVEEQKLPFPMGIAAAETLKAGDEGGKKAKTLFTWMGISAVFTYLRDGLGWIPVVFHGFGMFPMAIGIGFIIGSLYTMSWLAGGVTSIVLAHFGITATNFGLGMIVGGGLGMMLSGLFKSGKFLEITKIDIIVMLVVFVLSLIFHVGIVASLFLMILGFLMVHMAGAVDGTSGIDPMEVFAIITLMLTRAVVDISPQAAVFIAATIAVATGIAGDSLQDMKTGYILKTNPKAQLVSEAVGAAVGVLVSTFVLYAIYSKFGPEAFGPSKTFPIPQAMAVSNFVKTSSVNPQFIWGIVVALVLQLLKLPALTFGIGLYLPLSITLPVAVGGVIRLILDLTRKDKIDTGMIISSGLLGGEGITGILIGLFLPGSF